MKRDWEPLSAAVLAGGKSSRMGTDKALLPLEADGPPMLEIVLDRLKRVADEVFVIANDRERYGEFGVPVVPDLHPGSAALGGIHTAVSTSSHEHCFVVACDMPFLCVPLLATMAREPRTYDVLVPETPGESRQHGKRLVFQTLHAIYGKGCLSPIASRIERHQFQVIGFFTAVRVRTVQSAEVEKWDPEFRSFFNANTPEALAIASVIWRTSELYDLE